MTPEVMYEQLKVAESEDGCILNPDKGLVLVLLAGLILNRERYGYGSCPSRLATKNFELDQEIICPCIFRKIDVALHGRCYAGLYVNGQQESGTMPEIVPERWLRSEIKL